MTPGPIVSASPAPLVDLDDVTFSYGARRPALEHVTLALSAGDALGLVGPNGAGKSTLLKGILGLVPVISGRADVLGGAGRSATGGIGYMPQTDEIDPEFPVSLRQVVGMGRYRGLGPFRWPGRRDREATVAALERVGLASHANVRFGALSGGQQQRGILARALVSAPRLLLLDEPFNGLDRTSRERLVATIRELRGDGVGVVVSTHDLDLARDVCSHVVLLDRHQIAAGTIDETLTASNLRRTFDRVTADDVAHGHEHEHGVRRERGSRSPEEPVPLREALDPADAGRASASEGHRP